MTREEMRKIVFDAVEVHGPEKARRILSDRVDNDFDFMIAAAKYGHEFLSALKEAETATMN